MTDLFGQKLAKDVSVDLGDRRAIRRYQWRGEAKAQRAPESTDGRIRRADRRRTIEQDRSATRAASGQTPTDPQVRSRSGRSRSHPRSAEWSSGSAGPSAYKIPVSAVNVPTYRLYTAALPELAIVQRMNTVSKGVCSAGARRNWNWITPGVPSQHARRKIARHALDAKRRAKGRGHDCARRARPDRGRRRDDTQRD